MCTAFIKNGDDFLFGYNLDVDPDVWKFALIKTKEYFSVGITVGRTTYLTHGVNKNGLFGCLPYMNGPTSVGSHKNTYRIDLLVDRLIRGRLSVPDIREILKTKTIVNLPNASLHALCGDPQNVFMIEPSLGTKTVTDDSFVVTNFPLFQPIDDFSDPFYGKHRYDSVSKVLSGSGKRFTAADGMKLLQSVRQEGQWATRVSFVWSKNENAVYYCTDGDFTNIKKWSFDG